MRIGLPNIRRGLALCVGLAICVASIEAEAMPLQSLVDTGQAPGLTLVVGGCGVGFHRGPAGACRANGVAVVGAGVARVGVARVGVAPVGVDRRVSRRVARRTTRRVIRRHVY